MKAIKTQIQQIQALLPEGYEVNEGCDLSFRSSITVSPSHLTVRSTIPFRHARGIGYLAIRRAKARYLRWVPTIGKTLREAGVDIKLEQNSIRIL